MCSVAPQKDRGLVRFRPTFVQESRNAAKLIEINGAVLQVRSVSITMNRGRRYLRARLSMLAIVALVWSQFVLASHPAGWVLAMASAEAIAPMAVESECHHPTPAAESTLCMAHCSQGHQSSEVGRVPPVPALMAALAAGIASIVALEGRRSAFAELPPPASWHRPTSHPASLLLI